MPATSNRQFVRAQQYNGLQLTAVLECLNPGIQPALVASCFILVHQALSGHAVEYWNRSCIGRRCRGLVASINCRYNTLNVGTHHRTHASVSGTSCFCLTSAFFRLGGVRQVVLLEKLKIQPNSIVRALSVVNRSSRYSGRLSADVLHLAAFSSVITMPLPTRAAVT